MKINHQDFSKMFLSDLEGYSCIEVNFELPNNTKYYSCWMGKKPDNFNVNKDIYWFGLTDGGQDSYDFASFEEFYHSPVFDGNCLHDILDEIVIFSIDGSIPEEAISCYLE